MQRYLLLLPVATKSSLGDPVNLHALVDGLYYLSRHFKVVAVAFDMPSDKQIVFKVLGV